MGQCSLAQLGLSLTLSVLEVVAPQRSDFVLTAHVPHCEADVLVFYSFNVETYTAEVERG